MMIMILLKNIDIQRAMIENARKAAQEAEGAKAKREEMNARNEIRFGDQRMNISLIPDVTY